MAAAATACEPHCSSRDPISFDADDFTAFLTEMSISPDARISIHRARLSFYETYTHATPAGHRRTRPRRHLRSAVQNLRRQTNEGLVARAALSHRINLSYFLGLAARESGFNHMARAPTSSAAGLFQFTENTWLCVLRLHGPAAGIDQARMITRRPSGRCSIDSPLARWRLLALRYDPTLNSTMAAELTKDHQSALRSLLGREPTSGELYTLHFLGIDEGNRFLRANLKDLADVVTPRAAASNKSVYYTPQGRPRTVGEVRELIDRSFAVN
ncbi:hypothetical protein Astex_3779 (plasmid) [Asticcacaulis excentricus CB 48]|uniref:Transglycosylase SLT domain-containing protein n=2 Tax=Asticcacaulis excentricus TaxID=78587 RepID=E8RVW7_ASTEC|nr:hypothetical protein Astex_3779 [Asticcacaulis excentricus CB 48]